MNALVSLVSFGVSGIYLSFLLTVIGSMIARRRGWIPEGSFQLGRWGWAVSIVAAVYLGLMFLNVVVPTGLSSPRGYFNLDWITLFVIFIIAVVGAAYYLVCAPGPEAREPRARRARADRRRTELTFARGSAGDPPALPVPRVARG